MTGGALHMTIPIKPYVLASHKSSGLLLMFSPQGRMWETVNDILIIEQIVESLQEVLYVGNKV